MIHRQDLQIKAAPDLGHRNVDAVLVDVFLFEVQRFTFAQIGKQQ